MAEIELVSQNQSFGGVQYVYKHQSQMTGGTMTFAVFVPRRLKRARSCRCSPICRA